MIWFISAFIIGSSMLFRHLYTLITLSKWFHLSILKLLDILFIIIIVIIVLLLIKSLLLLMIDKDILFWWSQWRAAWLLITVISPIKIFIRFRLRYQFYTCFTIFTCQYNISLLFSGGIHILFYLYFIIFFFFNAHVQILFAET